MNFEDIEKHALETYTLNMEYLKNNHIKLYEKINLFETALNSGLKKEKYDLNYKDGYFDVINLETNEYIYGQDTEKYGQDIVKNQLDFSPKSCSFKAFYEIKFSDKVAKESENANMFSDAVISNAPIIHYVNSNLPKNETMKTIPKLIVFGVALGSHIPYLHMATKAKIYLIIEPNLELFRLSLFTIKYHNMSNFSKLIFSIAENEANFNQSFDSFYNTGFIYNHYFKHFMFSKNCDFYIQLIQKKLVTQTHLTYNYSMMLESFHRTVNYIEEDYNILNITPNKFKGFDKPILLLGAGPSLQKNIDFIKENQDKYIIVAVYVLLPFLEKHNIKPDIITQYDQKGDVVYNYIKRVKDISFFDDTIFLFASHLDKRVMESFPKENIFLFQSMYDVKTGFSAQTAPSIGEISYALLLRLGAKKIYLLGIDMAIDPETNETHISDHGRDSLSSSFKKEKNNKFTLRDDLVDIKGNLRETVQSNAGFIISINVLNRISANFVKNKDIEVFNLADGAYFEDIIPIKVEEIDINKNVLIDKKEFNKQLFNSLLDISEKGFVEKEKDIISLKLESANKLKEIIIEFFSIKDSSLIVYENRLGQVINDICFGNYSCYELRNILLNFIRHNAHYIYYLINIKSLDNPKKQLKSINKIMQKQLLKIVDTYIQIYK